MLRATIAGAAFAVGAATAGAIHLAAQAAAQPPGSAPHGETNVAVTDPQLSQDLETMRGLWAGGRYRLTPGDVVDVNFPYVGEFNQTVSVQPDGYIALRGIRDIHVAGLTVPELRQEVVEAYSSSLRDPVVTIVLKEFEKPYFVASGEVTHPGRYEIRGATTLTQALALAGGPTASAKQSAVVLFRRLGNELINVKMVDVQKMFASRNLSEDPVLRPGDLLFVSKSRMSSILPWIPKPGLGWTFWR